VVESGRRMTGDGDGNGDGDGRQNIAGSDTVQSFLLALSLALLYRFLFSLGSAT
jgi:hypothetical protein